MQLGDRLRVWWRRILKEALSGSGHRVGRGVQREPCALPAEHQGAYCFVVVEVEAEFHIRVLLLSYPYHIPVLSDSHFGFSRSPSLIPSTAMITDGSHMPSEI